MRTNKNINEKKSKITTGKIKAGYKETNDHTTGAKRNDRRKKSDINQ